MSRYPRSYNGPLQIYETAGIQFATSLGGEGPGSGTALLRLHNPGGENRIKIVIAFCGQDGAAIPIGGITQSHIWIHEDEDIAQGGASRGPYPCADVEGTAAAPTAFPLSADLFGYSREFVTSGEWLGVTLSLTDPGMPGTWYAKALLYPAQAYYPWEAWDTLRRAFEFDCLAKTVT